MGIVAAVDKYALGKLAKFYDWLGGPWCEIAEMTRKHSENKYGK